MSGWYLDPVTGKKISWSGDTPPASFTALMSPMTEATLIESGPGYLSTSWLDKLFSWAGKIASVGAGGAPGVGTGAGGLEWMPRLSITRPPGSDMPCVGLPGLAPGGLLAGGGVGEAGEAVSSGSAGLMPWAIGAAVVVGLLFFVKFK